jgi:ElaA protein
MSEITTEWHHFDVLTASEFYELLRFRQDIFVVEQHSPYPDLDDLDERAWHLIAREEGELAGYLRLIAMTHPPLVRVGRVAVSPPLRRCGLGGRLVPVHKGTFFGDVEGQRVWAAVGGGSPLRFEVVAKAEGIV